MQNNQENMVNQDNVVEQEPETKKKTSKLAWACRILAVLLLLLVFLSGSVLAIRLGDFLPNNTNIIFLIPKEPNAEAADPNTVWETDTDVDIFSAYSINGEGVITVQSSNDDNVVAPGTSGYYRFDLKNTGNVALDFTCLLTTEVVIKGAEFENLPIVIRLRDYKGNYLIGSNDEWECFDKVAMDVNSMTLGKGSYVYYELEWRWAFEDENENSDEFDTFIGNVAADEGVFLSINISTTATQSEEADIAGGIVSNDDIKTGGDIDVIPYVILNIIILLIIIALIVISLFLKKKKEVEPEETDESVDETIKDDSNSSETTVEDDQL